MLFVNNADDSQSSYSPTQLLSELFFIWASLILIRDIAWYFFNLTTKNQTAITAMCYNLFEKLLPSIKTGFDYSEGIFDFQNPAMTLTEATQRKYDLIFDKLELKSGMTLLDAGCGTGVWMDYCRKKGVTVTGLTLSSEQAIEVGKKGLTAFVSDYRVKNPAFLGQFDRISALGSTEHVCSSRGVCAPGNQARKRSIETYFQMLELFKTYLKPEGKIFVTVLTSNDAAVWTLSDYIQAWVMDGYYGGYYPHMRDLQEIVVPAAGLIMTDIEDHTASYHWSSMVEPKHFGFYTLPWRENLKGLLKTIIVDLLKNPLQFPFHWLYQMLNTWMWQFGGPQATPLTPEQVKKAPAQLKYFLLAEAPKRVTAPSSVTAFEMI